MINFIIGTGRCGTTMLAQMLNSHSKVCVPFELQILFENSNNGARLYEIFKEKKNENFGPEDFIELIEARSPHKFHEYFDYRSFFEKQQYPILNLKELVNSLYKEIAKSKHKQIFFEQTPWYGQRIDILDELFPDAKYIHMVRDGRDVAISFSRTPWWYDDVGQNLERWYTEVTKIIDSSRKILNPDQILQVRYEDIVEQPENELRRICDFLSIDFEGSMVDPITYIDYRSFSRLNAKTISSSALNEWAKHKSNPTFKGSCYAWKNYPDFDFSAMPKYITNLLKNLGYETKQPLFFIPTAISFTLKSHKEKLIFLLGLSINKMYSLRSLLKKIMGNSSSRRQSTFCPTCNRAEIEFLPLPSFYGENARQYGFVHFGNGEMTSHDTYTCSNCGASDRERLYSLWIEQQIEKKIFTENTRVIHFAPEAALSQKLRRVNFFDYKTADLLMDNVDYKVDMMNMPFDDASFDFFICSHVLEHVESDDQAIKELYRITAPGGKGILMAPIVVGLEKTVEDPSIKDEAGRWRLFGQNDHVRLYAHDDYVNKIRSHGFHVEELDERHFGENVFRALGLKRTSILYVVSK